MGGADTADGGAPSSREGAAGGNGGLEGSDQGFALLGEAGVLLYLAALPELADRLGGAATSSAWQVHQGLGLRLKP